MVPKHLDRIRKTSRSYAVLQDLKRKRGTIEDVSVALGIAAKFISVICTQLRMAKAIHACDWEVQHRPDLGTKRAVAVYAYGPGENEPRPKSIKGIKVTRIAEGHRGSQTATYFGQGIGKVSSIFQLGCIYGGNQQDQHEHQSD
jgi:hypothetical protein